ELERVETRRRCGVGRSAEQQRARSDEERATREGQGARSHAGELTRSALHRDRLTGVRVAREADLELVLAGPEQLARRAEQRHLIAVALEPPPVWIVVRHLLVADGDLTQRGAAAD